jgi:hypothetical protein
VWDVIDKVFVAIRDDTLVGRSRRTRREEFYEFKSIIYPKELEDQSNIPANV